MEKIEKIRKQPEHIRMRYVWFFVAVSMLFVIILWIFSLTTAKLEVQSNPTESTFFNSGILNDLSQQQKTLGEARKNAEKSLTFLMEKFTYLFDYKKRYVAEIEKCKSEIKRIANLLTK